MYLSTYDQDVVELLHAVDLGQQLVDDSVVDSRASCHAATLLTDRIDLVKYDDVKAAVGTELFGREMAAVNMCCHLLKSLQRDTDGFI